MSNQDLSVKMNKDFKGIWIPRELIRRLAPRFNLIGLVCNNYYFQTPIRPNKWKVLVKAGLARKIEFTPEELRIFISNKSPQRILGMPAFETCHWCKCNTYRLHNHHFPIMNKEGGSLTVEICAQCHDEYHFLNENLYSLSDEVFQWFKELNEVNHE